MSPRRPHPGAGAPPPDAGLDALRTAIAAGEPEAALARFQTLLDAPPEGAVAAGMEQAWSAFRPDEDRAGFRAQRAAARTDPVAALLLLARVAAGAGEGVFAVSAARLAVARAPALPAPAFLLCALLLRRRDAHAQASLGHCLEAFPQPSEGWADLGAALADLGKPDAALVCLARGLPRGALAIRRGLLARDLGRRDAARAAFEEAVRHDGRAPRAWFLLGTAAQDQRDLPAAAAAYRRALDLAPALAEAAVNLGTVLQEAGDLEGAKAAYGQAVALRPDTFGRIAQAMTTAPRGELWLDLGALRRRLTG